MKHVIIGSGVAGMTAALELARREDADVQLYTDEPYSYYYRPQITNFLAGNMSLEKVLMRPVAWYEEKGVHLHLNAPVARLEPEAHQIVLQDGAVVAYERLLFATGSHAFVPPIAGADKAGVFTIRTVDDAVKIRAYAGDCREAVVIGGGLLGLEAARGLQGLGLQITIVELMPRLMPLQLDDEGAAILKRYVAQQGFEVILETSVTKILGDERVTGVALREGRELPAQMLVIAAGVRPNTALAEAAGLKVFRGVSVDARMRTSAPDIYAAGDVAIFGDRCWAIVPTAQAQARVAAANMAGEELLYEEVIPTTALKVLGIDVNSMGDILPEGEGAVEICRADPEAFSYKKVVLREGRLVGAIVIGDKVLAKQLEGLVLAKEALDQEAASALL